MKKIGIILGLLMIANIGHSQILISLLLGDKLNSDKLEFGLEGGFNWSAIKNLQDANKLRTFNLGFYFDFKLKNPSWMINTGVIVKSAMGADELPVYPLGDVHLDSSFKDGNVSRRINYFNVPVLLKYSFKNNFYIKSGIQLGLRYKAYDEFSQSVHETDDLTYKVKTKDLYTTLDAGLSLGVGYKLMKGNGMGLGLRYYYGLVNINKDESLPKYYNRSLYLTASIPIGKGKAKE